MSFFSRITSSSVRLPEDPAEGSESTASTARFTLPWFSRSHPTSDNDGSAPPQYDQGEELSRWDRLLLFAVAMAASLSCYIVSFMLLPVLALKPRKFALLWSLGSILFLFSFGVLQGFTSYFRHLFSFDRMWFTISFTLSIVFSLVASIVLKSTLLALISCIVQFISMVWYTVSYFPMGRQGLRLASTVATSQVDSWLNA